MYRYTPAFLILSEAAVCKSNLALLCCMLRLAQILLKPIGLGNMSKCPPLAATSGISQHCHGCLLSSGMFQNGCRWPSGFTEEACRAADGKFITIAKRYMAPDESTVQRIVHDNPHLQREDAHASRRLLCLMCPVFHAFAVAQLMCWVGARTSSFHPQTDLVPTSCYLAAAFCSCPFAFQELKSLWSAIAVEAWGAPCTFGARVCRQHGRAQYSGELSHGPISVKGRQSPRSLQMSPDFTGSPFYPGGSLIPQPWQEILPFARALRTGRPAEV